MGMRRFCLLLPIVLFLCDCASAQLNQLTLVIEFDSNPSGISLGGSGTPSASLAFGAVRAFGGTIPSGVTESVASASWTLSTILDVNVQKGSLDVLDVLSTSYTLTAQLQSADSQNTWKWNSTILSTASTTITSAGVYGSAPSYGFSLTIPFSAPAGSISNSINFTAVAN
jgi:hypothetical protein